MLKVLKTKAGASAFDTCVSLGAFAIMAALLVWFNRFVEQEVAEIDELDLKTRLITTGKQIALIYLLILAGSLTVTGIFHNTPTVSDNQQLINQVMQTNGLTHLWVVIMSVLVAPLVEETIYRLLLIGPKVLKAQVFQPTDKHRKIMSVISLLLFTWGHVSTQWETLNWRATNELANALTATLMYLAIAGVLTYDYYRHGDIKRTLAIHIGWNAFVSLIG